MSLDRTSKLEGEGTGADDRESTDYTNATLRTKNNNPEDATRHDCHAKLLTSRPNVHAEVGVFEVSNSMLERGLVPALPVSDDDIAHLDRPADASPQTNIIKCSPPPSLARTRASSHYTSNHGRPNQEAGDRTLDRRQESELSFSRWLEWTKRRLPGPATRKPNTTHWRCVSNLTAVKETRTHHA